SNHKRELDSLVLPAITYFARGITCPNRFLVYAIREDAVWPRFLEQYLRWPWPFSATLPRLRVKAAVLFIKGLPMGYVTQRSDLTRIQGQLQHFAELLDRGRELYWTPEGGLGLDGKFGRVRAGLYRIVQGSHSALRLLPVAVFYDFMTTRRTRCFVRFGSEMVVDRSLSRSAFEQQVRQAILREMTVNIGHLAAATLRELPPGARFRDQELEQGLVAHARRLRAGGFALDPRLTMRWTFKRRLKRFVGYAMRHGILRREGDSWRVAAGLQQPKMSYVLNELEEAERVLDG
ncbi:MAG TPA: hypothetical protein VKU60_00730, partial [Chloroflexota bacterium]|nr:hypothetical protein [Chloroflexota bacterium]